mgnify:CR=1 FL=1
MRIVIFEDENPAAERLQNMLRELNPAIEVKGVYDTVVEAIEILSGGVEADLIISDVELADGLCFGIFKEVKTEVPVIFTTAYNQYAIRAFETNAVHYLLKPVKANELEMALEKAGKHIAKQTPKIDYAALAESMVRKQEKTPKRYMVRYGNKMKIVNPADAAYFYSMQKSTFMVDWEGKSLPLDESLNQVENDLEAKSFFRINRNLIVSIKSIQSVDMLGKGRMKINLKNPPEEDQYSLVSADRSPEFRKWLQGRE